MKITVEIDEAKLARLMKLTGIRTKTRALDFALRMAERTARREKLLGTVVSPEDLEGAVDPAYDVLELRGERPLATNEAVGGLDGVHRSAALPSGSRGGPEAMAWGDEVLCGAVRCEVLRGIVNPRVHRRIQDLFEVLPMARIDEALWDQAAELAWSLDRRGVVLPLTDLVIASCAMRSGAAVVTTDGRFGSIPNLEILSSLPQR